MAQEVKKAAQVLVDAELERQRDAYGYTPKDDRHKTLGDFLTFMDVYLTKTKAAYTAHGPSYKVLDAAETELVKVLALGHAYFNSRYV